jgi:hypothetical protein
MQYFPINIRCADANIAVIGGDADIFTDDHGRPVEPADVLNKNLVLTDLDYLDDFLGGPDAISYIIVPELI